jgi:hypothetical protein
MSHFLEKNFGSILCALIAAFRVLNGQYFRHILAKNVFKNHEVVTMLSLSRLLVCTCCIWGRLDETLSAEIFA